MKSLPMIALNKRRNVKNKENEKISQLLIENGADVHYIDSFENTLLHDAAEMGAKKLVLLLINKGADVNAQNSFEQKPLHLAIKGKFMDVAEILKQHGANTDPVKDNKADSILALTTCGENIEAVKDRLEKDDRIDPSCGKEQVIDSYSDLACFSLESNKYKDKTCKEKVHKCVIAYWCREKNEKELAEIEEKEQKEKIVQEKLLKIIETGKDTCQDLSKHLKKCTPYKCQKTEKILIAEMLLQHNVIGREKDLCIYNKSLPEGYGFPPEVLTTCQFTKEMLQEYVKEVEQISSLKNSGLGFSGSTSYYIIDGKNQEMVLSKAFKSGQCKNMGGVEDEHKPWLHEAYGMGYSLCEYTCSERKEFKSCVTSNKKELGYFEAKSHCKPELDKCVSKCETRKLDNLTFY
jgi:hypothetical protein